MPPIPKKKKKFKLRKRKRVVVPKPEVKPVDRGPDTCIACQGSKVSSSGFKCPPCNGTGVRQKVGNL